MLIQGFQFLFILVLFSEMILRFYRLRYRPMRIRLAYSLFLLSPKTLKENLATRNRIYRGGFESENELFRHYEEISGLKFDEIEKYFNQNNKSIIFNRKYYSGGHGVFERMQKMHLGFMPMPSQNLKTLSINEKGWRDTGYDLYNDDKRKEDKICLLLGDSVLFGIGATSNENTIAGRLGYYLNQKSNNKFKYYVVNYGMLSFNSFQSLISLLESNIKPDYVVTFNGWNEIDQAINSGSKISSSARSCDNKANQSNIISTLKKSIGRLVLIRVFRRFIVSFNNYSVS